MMFFVYSVLCLIFRLSLSYFVSLVYCSGLASMACGEFMGGCGDGFTFELIGKDWESTCWDCCRGSNSDWKIFKRKMSFRTAVWSWGPVTQLATGRFCCRGHHPWSINAIKRTTGFSYMLACSGFPESMNLYLSLQVSLELIVLLIALIQLSNDGYLDSMEGGRIF